MTIANHRELKVSSTLRRNLGNAIRVRFALSVGSRVSGGRGDKRAR